MCFFTRSRLALRQLRSRRWSMTGIPYRTALVVGAGPGISASFARAVASAGLKVGLAARDVEKLAPLADETGAAYFCRRRLRPGSGGAAFRRPPTSELGEPDVVLFNASARAHGPIADIDPEAVRKAHRDFRLRRLPGGAAGGAAHDPEGSRRDPAHRRQRQRQGLPAIGRLRDGQVRVARPGAEHGAGARAKGHPRRPFHH